MTKILVIGSKGFIGTHVLAFYNTLDSYEPWGCDVVTDYGASKYFVIDAVNANFEEVFKSVSFDVCINCAGAASVPDSLLHPARDYYLNTNHVFNILDAIRKYTPKCKFLNLSSAAVYGNPVSVPIAEDTPVKPLSPYGWHKLQSELVCREYHEVFGLSTSSARIFSAYGPGLKKQLFWDWYQKVATTSHITVFGTGNESRDFIYIGDLVTAINCIVNKNDFTGNVINVANGSEIFIKDAIEVFRKAIGASFTYNFNNQVRKGDPLNWQADVKRLLSFGYRQQVSLEDGLNRYIQWLHEKK
jgi:UDP-glucose 4-epimerase